MIYCKNNTPASSFTSFSLLACVCLFFATNSWGQNAEEKAKIISQYDLEKLEQLRSKFEVAHLNNVKKAQELAKVNNWPLEIQLENGGFSQLVGVRDDLTPIYYTDENDGAALTARTNELYPGGSLGLNLTGDGMTISVWEVGAVRPTHQLFEGRVTSVQGGNLSDHASHVSGTIAGSGAFQNGAAQGMAYEAEVRVFSASGDEAEVISEAASGNLISSHSYGISAVGSSSAYLGKYDGNARDYDEIMYNAPYYLGVFSAGNDRNDGINATGYDLLTDMSCSKNGVTVAAVGQVSNYINPNSVNMSSFSSWGPTDDGRIKPDISAKGVSLYSAYSSSNTSYGTMSGTSMSTPSVSGTMLLLQQHYNETHGQFMLSSTLRGLVCHTADEAGANDGPDYSYGWGLINAKRAAETITNNGGSSRIEEIELNQGDTYSIEVGASGLEPLMASITWTDPKASVGPNIVNDRTPKLINDLDIRIYKNDSTYYPWKLDPDNPSDAAINSDNLVDNIEKIEIDSSYGAYQIEISHKGNLYSGTQRVSLIITGLVEEDCNGDGGGAAIVDSCGICSGGNTEIDQILATEDCQSSDLLELIFYPNPTQGELLIETSETAYAPFKVTITNMLGQVVYFSEIDLQHSPTSLNLNSLSAGSYSILLENDQHTFQERIVIQE